MTDFRQPWRRVAVEGRRCELQIVDPSTAFDLEPDLIGVLGETLSLFLAAPDQVFGAVLRRANGDSEFDVAALDSEPSEGQAHTIETIATLGRVLGQCIIAAQFEAAWVRQAFARLVFGRLRFGDRYVDGSQDWAGLGFGPLAKWQVMAIQIQQSFGPLWTRSPYTLRVPAKDYKVPQPTSVPVAVRYAAELAKAGVASSAREILDQWTPVQMIEVIETQAYAAEHERRAHEAAKSGAA